MEKTLELCCELIRRPSLTPRDAGCQALMMERLRRLGFTCTEQPCGEVSNFWAERGADGPILVFAGHTDVVPAGPANTGLGPSAPRSAQKLLTSPQGRSVQVKPSLRRRSIISV
ncbi:MAG: hypothetical protein DRQ98_03210, partial [Gammaproteobacteria bacterium]